jgi:hypothetical protein
MNSCTAQLRGWYVLRVTVVSYNSGARPPRTTQSQLNGLLAGAEPSRCGGACTRARPGTVGSPS